MAPSAACSGTDHLPHQFLSYRSPKEVGQTREDAQETEARPSIAWSASWARPAR